METVFIEVLSVLESSTRNDLKQVICSVSFLTKSILTKCSLFGGMAVGQYGTVWHYSSVKLYGMEYG